MDAINTLLGLALGAFDLFLQLIMQILSFFLVFFQAIFSVLHLQ
jgi:hypothetical protein